MKILFHHHYPMLQVVIRCERCCILAKVSMYTSHSVWYMISFFLTHRLPYASPLFSKVGMMGSVFLL